MFGPNRKRSLLTLALTAGLLGVAGPAGVGAAAGNEEAPASRQAHAPVSPQPSPGGHPSQGAPTVGGGITSKPEAYESPTPPS